MEDKSDGVFTAILALLLAIPTILLNGFVLVKLWAWFITPTFGVPGLEMTSAIGLSMIVGFLTHQMGLAEDKDSSLAAKLIASIIRPLSVLLVGWAITLFM